MINVPCSEDCTSYLPRKSFGSLSLELILLSKSPKTNLIKIRFFLFEKFSKYVVHYKLNLFLLCRTCYLLFVFFSLFPFSCFDFFLVHILQYIVYTCFMSSGSFQRTILTNMLFVWLEWFENYMLSSAKLNTWYVQTGHV